jgi:hypothetical protein
MISKRHRVATLVARASAVFALALCTASLGRADAGPAVRLGEVGVSVKDRYDLALPLRSALERELARIAGGLVATKRFVVSASLVKLERGPTGTRCVVSLVVVEARGGAMVAMLEGRAHSDDRADADLELALLAQATRGAMSGLPQAIR